MEKGSYTWALDALAVTGGCCSPAFSVDTAHICIYICDGQSCVNLAGHGAQILGQPLF